MGFLLFDRLVASTRFPGTALFLVNFADVFGQLASVGIVTYREIYFHNSVAASHDLHKWVFTFQPRPEAVDLCVTFLHRTRAHAHTNGDHTAAPMARV